MENYRISKQIDPRTWDWKPFLFQSHCPDGPGDSEVQPACDWRMCTESLRRDAFVKDRCSLESAVKAQWEREGGVCSPHSAVDLLEECRRAHRDKVARQTWVCKSTEHIL